MAPQRIALIHALRHSPAPIEAAFSRLWPEVELANLLDDSLSADLSKLTRADQPMSKLHPSIMSRFNLLGRYAIKSVEADAVLFTCSAFGAYIDNFSASVAPFPVLKPNEAMLDDLLSLASEHFKKINQPLNSALVATFSPTLNSMIAEIQGLINDRQLSPQILKIHPLYVDGAMAALNDGNGELHDALVTEAVNQLCASHKGEIEAIALAQFSLARSAPVVAISIGKTVLTTPDSAVTAMRQRLRASC